MLWSNQQDITFFGPISEHTNIGHTNIEVRALFSWCWGHINVSMIWLKTTSLLGIAYIGHKSFDSLGFLTLFYKWQYTHCEIYRKTLSDQHRSNRGQIRSHQGQTSGWGIYGCRYGLPCKRCQHIASFNITRILCEMGALWHNHFPSVLCYWISIHWYPQAILLRGNVQMSCSLSMTNLTRCESQAHNHRSEECRLVVNRIS